MVSITVAAVRFSRVQFENHSIDKNVRSFVQLYADDCEAAATGAAASSLSAAATVSVSCDS